jgi:tRNA A58 N-methylase Trm61
MGCAAASCRDGGIAGRAAQKPGSSHVRTCQKTKVGDLVDPKYLDGLLACSLIAQAIEAYDAGAYQQAVDLYKSAAAVPGGTGCGFMSAFT